MNTIVVGRRIDYSKLPDHMQEGMKLYIEDRVEPGSFLMAVLANDLMESFGRADDINRERLYDFCQFLYNTAPSACHGSYEKVNKWLNPE